MEGSSARGREFSEWRQLLQHTTHTHRHTVVGRTVVLREGGGKSFFFYSHFFRGGISGWEAPPVLMVGETLQSHTDNTFAETHMHGQ